MPRFSITDPATWASWAIVILSVAILAALMTGDVFFIQALLAKFAERVPR